MKLSEEETNEIVRLYLEKNTIRELAKKFGVGKFVITNILKAKGVTPDKSGYPSNRRFPPAVEQDIIERYKRGESQVDISKLYNTFNTSIRRVLVRNDIPIRPVSKVRRLCKHNPFKRNDECSDYFLGLLLTDGCISGDINLSLSEVDSYLVYFFRDWASPEQKVSKILQKRNSSYMYACNIRNAETAEWLQRNGNFKRKSYNAKLYKKMNWSIFRGIFDGDGGWYAQNGEQGLRLSICGYTQSPLLKQVSDFLQREGYSIHRYDNINSTGSPICTITVYKIKDVLSIGLKMYSNAHVFMNRKYMKWLTLYENIGEKYGLNSGKAGIANPERNLPTPHEVKYEKKQGRAETIMAAPKHDNMHGEGIVQPNDGCKKHT